MGKDYSVSAVRFVAMILIVCCHYLQARNHWLAYHLNVGVQIFFALSGYLFGKRRIDNPLEFLKRRTIRILVPYYVFIILAIGIFAITGCSLGPKSVFQLISISVGPSGFGHLWFVSTILMLYFFTPYLQLLTPYILKGSPKRDVIRIVTILVLYSFWAKTHNIGIGVDAFASFLFGYMISYAESIYGGAQVNGVMICVATTGVIAFISRITLECYAVQSQALVPHIKAISGCGFMCLGLMLFKRINLGFFDITDRYSYEVYLCHHIFLLGPLSCKISTCVCVCGGG